MTPIAAEDVLGQALVAPLASLVGHIDLAPHTTRMTAFVVFAKVLRSCLHLSGVDPAPVLVLALSHCAGTSEKTVLVPLRAVAGLPAVAADVAEFSTAKAAMHVVSNQDLQAYVVHRDSRHMVAADRKLHKHPAPRACTPALLRGHFKHLLSGNVRWARTVVWCVITLGARRSTAVRLSAASPTANAVLHTDVCAAGFDAAVKRLVVVKFLFLGSKFQYQLARQEGADVF